MSWLTITIEDGLRSWAAQMSRISAQAFGRERVDLAERLVHKKNLRIDGQSAGGADALLHAAGEFARIRVFEASQSDHADGMFGPGVDFIRRKPGGLQHGADVFGDSHPGIKRETLKHDRHAGVQAVQRLIVIQHFALRGTNQAGKDAEDGRFAAARRAQQRHDFVGADAKTDVFQHAQRLAVGQREVVRHMAGFAEGGGVAGRSKSRKIESH